MGAITGTPEELPHELSLVLNAAPGARRDHAWAQFVETYSRLLLHTARHISHDHDAAMDAYAFILEHLQADDHRRLRAYGADKRGKFTTWLVVVARRLCLDFLRQRYGRARPTAGTHDVTRATRARLVDLIGEELESAPGAGVETQNPETLLQATELKQALESALAELSPRDRVLLALRFQDDVPVRDIAAALNLPSQFHVYRRLKIVLGVLRERLVRRGVMEPHP